MIETTVFGKIITNITIGEKQLARGNKVKTATYTVCTGKDFGKWCSIEVVAMGRQATYAEHNLQRGGYVYLVLNGAGTGEPNKFSFTVVKQRSGPVDETNNDDSVEGAITHHYKATDGRCPPPFCVRILCLNALIPYAALHARACVRVCIHVRVRACTYIKYNILYEYI